MKTGDKATPQNRKQRNIIIALSVICLLLIGGMVFVLNMPKQVADTNSTTKSIKNVDNNGVPKANAKEETTESNGVKYSATTNKEGTTSQTPAMANQNITFPGFATGTYKFTDKSQTLSLMNPQSNTVIFVFKIYDTSNEKLIYTSDKISPNQTYEWNVQDYFTSGTHKIKIHISTTDIKTGTSLNGIDEYFTFVK